MVIEVVAGASATAVVIDEADDDCETKEEAAEWDEDDVEVEDALDGIGGKDERPRGRASVAELRSQRVFAGRA
jgi:hypothetical protein